MFLRGSRKNNLNNLLLDDSHMIYMMTDWKVIEVLSIEHQPRTGCGGWSSDRSKYKWEVNYADFETCDGIPAKGTKEYNWMNHQLSTGPAGLDAKIKREIKANEGGTICVCVFLASGSEVGSCKA